MKHLILVGLFGFSLPALAISECAGFATDGTYVTLSVNTSGPKALASNGEVVFERGGNKFGYRFEAAEISQFFEYDDLEAKSAMFGMNAFVGGEAPVQAKYNGPNFVDMDLKVVLKEREVPARGNFLRVWKGPPTSSTEQYQVTKVACAVWAGL